MLSTVKPAVFCIFLSVSTFSGIAESITRIACVGDSITYSAAIRDRVKNCYPMVLGGLLGGKYSVRNFGVNGATLLKKVAQDTKLTVIDLHMALSGKPEMFPDKIHPNAVGAKVMVRTIFSVLKKKH